jgi:hypothetical protein
VADADADADDAASWRALADQLTPEQVAELERLEQSWQQMGQSHSRYLKNVVSSGDDQRRRLLSMAQLWVQGKSLVTEWKGSGSFAELFSVPPYDRDQAWIERFYAVILGATLLGFDPEVETGPDGFPYFQMAVHDLARAQPHMDAPYFYYQKPASGGGPKVSLSGMLDYLLDIGCGAVVFAEPDRSGAPEWVFSYGDLLSYKLYQRFDGAPPEIGDNAEASTHADDGGRRGSELIVTGHPSEQYLPAKARRAMGMYMRQVLRRPDPRVLWAQIPSRRPPVVLSVNLTPADFQGDSGKLQAALNRLTWFVPKTYAVVSELTGVDTSRYVPLE